MISFTSFTLHLIFTYDFLNEKKEASVLQINHFIVFSLPSIPRTPFLKRPTRECQLSAKTTFFILRHLKSVAHPGEGAKGAEAHP